MIYFDNNATTKLDEKVFKAMCMDLQSLPMNPSSSHFLGRKASIYLKNSRKKIADFFSCDEEEIIFTSSATESLNMIIKGFHFKKNDHVITTDIEHACVYNNCLTLEKNGVKISFLKTGLFGAVKPQDIEKAIKPSTKCIILSYVNSETGVLTDIDKIAKIAEENNIYLVVDGVAILGKKRFLIPNGVSAMAFSMHKIHGPKGIGVTFIRKNLKLTPLLLGGLQEYKKRAGTENLAGILAAAKAIEIIDKNIDQYQKKIEKLKDAFEDILSNNLDISINGQGKRICNTSNISFNGIDGEDLIILLDKKNIAASHGSACSSKSLSPSRILTNMGIDRKKVLSSVRFSFSKYTTYEEINNATSYIIEIVKKLKEF